MAVCSSLVLQAPNTLRQHALILKSHYSVKQGHWWCEYFSGTYPNLTGPVTFLRKWSGMPDKCSVTVPWCQTRKWPGSFLLSSLGKWTYFKFKVRLGKVSSKCACGEQAPKHLPDDARSFPFCARYSHQNPCVGRTIYHNCESPPHLPVDILSSAERFVKM